MQGRAARLATAIGAATMAITMAGCGSLSVTNGPVAGSADAPHLTQAQFVPEVTKAMTVSGAVHVVARMTLGGKATEVDEDTSMMPGGSIQLSLKDEAGLYGRASGRTFELRLVGNNMYISAPAREGKFLAYSSGDSHTLCGCVARHLRYAVSPAGRLSFWRQGMVGLTFLGLEAGDGLYLEHYRAQVAPARIVGAKMARQLKLPSTMSYELWLDSDHLLRRITGHLDGLKLEITYSKWGKRVDVDEPGPKDIVNQAAATKA